MGSEMLLSLAGVDQQLTLWLNGMNSPFFDNFMSLYSGKFIWVPMYVAILYVMLRNYHWRTVLLCVVGIALTITFADQVCSSLIRPIVARPRPASPDSPVSDLVHIVNGSRGGHYGFPSCHAANSFGLAVFLMLLMKRRTLNIFMFSWAIINCYSRIYLGRHYVGDIIVGALVGSVGAYVIFYIVSRFIVQYVQPAKEIGWITKIGVIVLSFIILFSVIPIEKVFPNFPD
jgi:undecaprenyl-diphosphatase